MYSGPLPQAELKKRTAKPTRYFNCHMRKSAPMHALEKRKVSSLQNPLTHFLSKTQVGLQKSQDFKNSKMS